MKIYDIFLGLETEARKDLHWYLPRIQVELHSFTIHITTTSYVPTYLWQKTDETKQLTNLAWQDPSPITVPLLPIYALNNRVPTP